MNNYWLEKPKAKQDDCHITLNIEGKEMIKLSKKGFFVEGRLVAEDKEIYEAFSRFLRQVNAF